MIDGLSAGRLGVRVFLTCSVIDYGLPAIVQGRVIERAPTKIERELRRPFPGSFDPEFYGSSKFDSPLEYHSLSFILSGFDSAGLVGDRP
jgi:hypothetical protein